MTDRLGELNEALERTIEETRERVTARRQARGYVDGSLYMVEVLKNELGLPDAKIEFISRSQFDADVTITIPAKLKELGVKTYIETEVPLIVNRIQKSALHKEGTITELKQAAFYVNLRLSDEYFLQTILTAIQTLGERYGEHALFAKKDVVVDYSSPNVAKHLHAGHIRSTIIGEVLSNIYEAVGYTAHRINHINDWGGFGFLLEAYARFQEKEEAYPSKNDFLYFLYTTYRQLEKDAEHKDGAPFVEFKEKADERFRNLEAGRAAEVSLWQKMVAWSLADFERFYDLIDIHLDYVIGESFYARRGAVLVEEALKEGRATIENEAAVVHVGDETDFVIRRADESTIYATRDLAALQYRSEKMRAERMVYVVGQEQVDYFAKLFRAADILGIVKLGTVLQHVPFGFYVSAHAKKKLSSREGAQNVIELVEAAIRYFTEKYPDLSDGDAKKLAVGSITFNDIKKNRMMAVELDTGNMHKTIERFEESGAAYVMYAATRARSIVRKYGKAVPTLGDATTQSLALEAAELSLVKRMGELPLAIMRAAETNEPSVLAEYLMRLAQEYNSYYESHPVLSHDGSLEHPHRLIITYALVQVLINGLRLCHVEIPDQM